MHLKSSWKLNGADEERGGRVDDDDNDNDRMGGELCFIPWFKTMKVLMQGH